MASSALRSFSRRNLSPIWFCKTSSTSPPLVLHHDVKDYTGPSLTDPSLLARNFHKQLFFEDRKKMSFAHQPLGSSSGGVFLCRHISSSSSSSSKPEEWSIKIDALGDVVEGLVPEKSVEAMVTTIDGSSAESEFVDRLVYSSVYCVQYVINAIHDLTGFNWSMSVVLTALVASGLMWPFKMHIQRQVWKLKNLRMRIQKVRRVIQTYDPKGLAENKLLEAELLLNILLEAELQVNFGLCGVFYMPLCYLDLMIPMYCITGITNMATTIPEFENGGLLWFTDLSTLDGFYMLPLVTAFTYWFTSKVPTTTLSRLKELPLYCIFFIVVQAAFKYKPAVYFFLITYKISLYTLHMMCRSKQIAKMRKSLGEPYVPVTAYDQERIMPSVITVMREYINAWKKEDK